VVFVRKAVIILVLLAVLISTSSFTYQTNIVKNLSGRLNSTVNSIKATLQQATIQTGENMIHSWGVEKVELLDPSSLGLAEPVVIKESIPCIVIASDSMIAWILRASPINASGMTLNPLGIVTIGEMPEARIKEELYHWWDASRMGPLAYYATYLFEFGTLCVKNFSSNDAYWNLPLEVTAKEYANQ